MAAEHVPVHVEDGLARIGAGVKYQPPAGADALGCRDVGRDRRKLTRECRIFRRQGADILEMLTRYDEQVGRGAWRDVAEHDDSLGLVHEVRRDFTGDDPAEQAVGHRGPRGLVKYRPAMPPRPSNPAATTPRMMMFRLLPEVLAFVVAAMELELVLGVSVPESATEDSSGGSVKLPAVSEAGGAVALGATDEPLTAALEATGGLIVFVVGGLDAGAGVVGG